MKKLGILGGMGPESTLLYYEQIAMRYNARFTTGMFPLMTLEALDMYEAVGYCKAGEFDKLLDYLLKGVRNLEAAGAEVGVLASNTPHVVFGELQSRAKIPLISIVETTCRAVASRGFGRVAWLGTGFTMSHPYFKEAFARRGIEAVSPEGRDLERIDAIIADELEFGVILEESRREIDAVLEKMRRESGIEAAVLGCTELPLMYADALAPVFLFDTVELHIDAIMDYLFEDN